MIDEKGRPEPMTLKLRVYKLDIGFLVSAESATRPGYAPRFRNLALANLEAVDRSLAGIVPFFMAEIREELAKTPRENEK